MKDLEKIYSPLKLRAVDDRDLAIFSDCIYQSILLSTEIKYDKKNKIFYWPWKDLHGKLLREKTTN